MFRNRGTLVRANANQQPGPRAWFLLVLNCAACCLLLLVGLVALAQSPSATQTPSDDQAYRDAVAVAGPNGDVLKLERFASTSTGPHRKEALAWLVWTYRQMGDSSMATKWAYVLQSADPGNALALAMMANDEQQLTRTSPSEPGADQPLSLARQALRGLDHLAPPEGMPEPTFTALKADLARSLNGAVGYAYFQRRDYITARTFLRKAVAVAPDNAQYTYALALSDFEGNADPAEGFKMLARSVNLTLGTPAGRELAAFARAKYRFAGGSDANWDGFIAATRVPPQPQQAPSPEVAAQTQGTSGATGAAVQTRQAAAAPVSSASPVSSGGTASPATGSLGIGSTPGTANGRSETASSAQNTSRETHATETARATLPNTSIATAPTATASAQPRGADARTGSAKSVPPPSSTRNNDTSKRAVPALPAMASVTPPPVFPPRPPQRVFSSDAPVSLGILIETATTTPETRTNVINTLTDMVRRLRGRDEAFLVSFSNEVVFEQDLTNNSKSLEEAMDRIKPLHGTALFDAVAFAAGHLKRIAANQNRVLLVISDGANDTNAISPLELSGEITMSGVKIFCIGLQSATLEDQQRLSALANATGGQAVFLGRPAEFRGAAQEMAARLGIPF